MREKYGRRQKQLETHGQRRQGLCVGGQGRGRISSVADSTGTPLVYTCAMGQDVAARVDLGMIQSVPCELNLADPGLRRRGRFQRQGVTRLQGRTWSSNRPPTTLLLRDAAPTRRSLAASAPEASAHIREREPQPHQSVPRMVSLDEEDVQR